MSDKKKTNFGFHRLKLETHFILLAYAHMKNHIQYLICLLRACGHLSNFNKDVPYHKERKTGVSVMSRKETDYEN